MPASEVDRLLESCGHDDCGRGQGLHGIKQNNDIVRGVERFSKALMGLTVEVGHAELRRLDHPTLAQGEQAAKRMIERNVLGLVDRECQSTSDCDQRRAGASPADKTYLNSFRAQRLRMGGHEVLKRC